MPKKATELSALEVKRLLNKPGFHAVGGVSGLYLTVNNGTGSSWILRTKVGTKRKDIGLGGYPDVGLQEERQGAREAKVKVAGGVDPVAEKKAARAALVAHQKAGMTFMDSYTRTNTNSRKSFQPVNFFYEFFATYFYHGLGHRTLQDVIPFSRDKTGEFTSTAAHARPGG